MDSYRRTHQTWDKVAAAYEAGFMDVSQYADTFDAFCDLLPQPGARLFEIGCGPGNITKYLLEKRPDFRLTGIDVAPQMVALAQANNPTARFSVMDARAIGTLPMCYEGIMCGFCVPYLAQNDVAQLVQDCAALLERGGVLYLSVIEGNHAQSGIEIGSTGDGMMVYYYDEDFLRECLTTSGFELIDQRRIVFVRASGATSPNLILLARKA